MSLTFDQLYQQILDNVQALVAFRIEIETASTPNDLIQSSKELSTLVSTRFKELIKLSNDQQQRTQQAKLFNKFTEVHDRLQAVVRRVEGKSKQMGQILQNEKKEDAWKLFYNRTLVASLLLIALIYGCVIAYLCYLSFLRHPIVTICTVPPSIIITIVLFVVWDRQPKKLATKNSF